MKVTKVTYARTINLGNYENERIEYTADVDIDETPEEALEQLKALMTPAQPVITIPPKPYNLMSSTGAVILLEATSLEWLQKYDQGLSQASDLRAFIHNNVRELVRLAAECPSPDTDLAMARTKTLQKTS